MVSALSGSAGGASAYQPGGASPVDLQARLDRYQKQLSDCVNCASAKTPKGKADIAAISARIDDVKRAIAQNPIGPYGAAPAGAGQAAPAPTS